MSERMLFDRVEATARKRLGLGAEYEAHSVELLPHPVPGHGRKQEWTHVRVKMDAKNAHGKWMMTRHETMIPREEIEP